MLRGLDVSHHNGQLDWQDLARQGYAFMFSKATEGVNYIDKSFYINFNKAQEAGVKTGAYHFFHPNQDPILQVNSFMWTVGQRRPGDLPPVLDWEVTNNMDNEFQKANAHKWLEAVEKECGKKPLIYSSPAFLSALGDLSSFKDYGLWIAHYGVKEPRLVAPWKTWVFWQLILIILMEILRSWRNW